MTRTVCLMGCAHSQKLLDFPRKNPLGWLYFEYFIIFQVVFGNSWVGHCDQLDLYCAQHTPNMYGPEQWCCLCLLVHTSVVYPWIFLVSHWMFSCLVLHQSCTQETHSYERWTPGLLDKSNQRCGGFFFGNRSK